MSDVLELRRRAGKTQAALAAASGVAQPNIAAYETGRRAPSRATPARLRAATRPRPSTVVAEHRAAIARLVQRHHASNPRIFGSTARGTDTPDSDLDLLAGSTTTPACTTSSNSATTSTTCSASPSTSSPKPDSPTAPTPSPPTPTPVTPPPRTQRSLRDFPHTADKPNTSSSTPATSASAPSAPINSPPKRSYTASAKSSPDSPDEFLDEHPAISLRAIRGMRTISAHEYQAVDYHMLWTDLTTRLPVDAAAIRTMLSADKPTTTTRPHDSPPRNNPGPRAHPGRHDQKAPPKAGARGRTAQPHPPTSRTHPLPTSAVHPASASRRPVRHHASRPQEPHMSAPARPLRKPRVPHHRAFRGVTCSQNTPP